MNWSQIDKEQNDGENPSSSAGATDSANGKNGSSPFSLSPDKIMSVISTVRTFYGTLSPPEKEAITKGEFTLFLRQMDEVPSAVAADGLSAASSSDPDKNFVSFQIRELKITKDQNALSVALSRVAELIEAPTRREGNEIKFVQKKHEAKAEKLMQVFLAAVAPYFAIIPQYSATIDWTVICAALLPREMYPQICTSASLALFSAYLGLNCDGETADELQNVLPDGFFSSEEKENWSKLIDTILISKRGNRRDHSKAQSELLKMFHQLPLSVQTQAVFGIPASAAWDLLLNIADIISVNGLPKDILSYLVARLPLAFVESSISDDD